MIKKSARKADFFLLHSNPFFHNRIFLNKISTPHLNFMRNIFITALVILSSTVSAQEKSNNKPENWIKVEKDDFYEFIDCDGQEVVKPIYSNIEIATENGTEQ